MPERLPPDHENRQLALDPSSSILVQAPAGSGKTYLLTQRFLRLLAKVNTPGEIVAITFTNAAAAEMRHRILDELEKASAPSAHSDTDPLSLTTLAHRALQHSERLGWQLLEQPDQLRITTIDAFCRSLATERPLLGRLGGTLEIAAMPSTLYRQAARRTLEQLDGSNTALREAIESLLLLRDNHWQDMENLIVRMLAGRERWLQPWVVGGSIDWNETRTRLEAPFRRAVLKHLTRISHSLAQNPAACQEIMRLVYFAASNAIDQPLYPDLAALPELPQFPFDDLDDACSAYIALATFLQTSTGTWRKKGGLNKNHGFPATPEGRREKDNFEQLIESLDTIPNFAENLTACPHLPPAAYTDEEWTIVRSSFTVLQRAAAELDVIFAETGTVDFVRIAQLAQQSLSEDDTPSDFALTVGDEIKHLLVDEFQDTSRRQHQLLTSVIAAWPERPGRSVFCVGDPMQSIYGFREAEVELFSRVRHQGLEPVNDEPLAFDFRPLSANFRTTPPLVHTLNLFFQDVFSSNDGSGVSFNEAYPMRETNNGATSEETESEFFHLHLSFIPPEQTPRHSSQQTADEQLLSIVELVQSELLRVEEAKHAGRKHRVAILARKKSSLTRIATALRQAQIPFRAIEMEPLRERPEIQDVLSLLSALLNPADRTSWLGLLRAPWCGLSLADLHALAGDAPSLTIPQLLETRIAALSPEGQQLTLRILPILQQARETRFSYPGYTLGTWLATAWRALGGESVVDAAGLENLRLLWSALDSLPEGEPDLLGPALEHALNELNALPDPASSSEHGVQLMTIHKSKGLEFETVLVPDLHARDSSGSASLLSWLERGLTSDDDEETTTDPTEFLIAPIQPRGAQSGSAKNWVDSVLRRREEQERRRLLYVASTRAREHLHLFARLKTTVDPNDNSLSLVPPANSLLSTAWPAIAQEVQSQFDVWVTNKPLPESQPDEAIPLIAATAATTPSLTQMPNRIRRLPLSELLPEHVAATGYNNPVTHNETLFTRHEGNLASRAAGLAVHAFIEQLSRLRATHSEASARALLPESLPRISTSLRALGLSASESAQISQNALEPALRMLDFPIGRWILAPHESAFSEAALTGTTGTHGKEQFWNIRIDRIFRAGLPPENTGDETWWIVDYKTASPGNPQSPADLQAFLERSREQFAPQLESYARILRQLQHQFIPSGPNTPLETEKLPIRVGLYYPFLEAFDWWKL